MASVGILSHFNLTAIRLYDLLSLSAEFCEEIAFAGAIWLVIG
jgi:hypothetical protein